MCTHIPCKVWLVRSWQVLLVLVLLFWAWPPAPARAAGHFTVNSFFDYNEIDHYLELREALAIANGDLLGPFTNEEKAQLGGDCGFSGADDAWYISGGCGKDSPDTIVFSSGLGGIGGTIHLNPVMGVLPDISEYYATSITGPSASGAEIAIDGSDLFAGPLLTISSEYNGIFGHLAFINSPDIGLNITGNNNGVDEVRAYGNGSYGIQISGDHNDVLYAELGFRSLSNPTLCEENTDNATSNIVLADGAESNIIRNNTLVCSLGAGIWVTGATAASNTIANNYVGVWNKGGSLRLLGNSIAGIAISAGSHDNTLNTNYIGGNGAGIALTGEGTDNNEIFNNYIGRVTLGNIPNNLSGIVIGLNAQSNQIHDNSIAMNAVAGVVIDDSIANNTVVENNDIYGNTSHGVILRGATIGNTIRGNHIFNNSGAGIQIAGTAYGNLIETGSIHNNTGAGIVQEASAGPNLWRTLSIYANGGLGIDTLANGIPNGPYPTITGIEPAGGGGLAVKGTAELSTSVELYRVDPDPSGFGEGKTYLGNAPTDGTGHWSITIPAGSLGTLTALQAKSTEDGPDASEFGPNVTWFNVYLPLIMR